MKIIKKKKVVEEEIQIEVGTYYFTNNDLSVYKFSFEEDEGNYINYKLEVIENFSNRYGITLREDWSDGQDNLPYSVEQFLLKMGCKEITEEEFLQEKKEVLDRILKQ